MVISATKKMFLLTFVLFIMCVVLFFVLVALRKNEKTNQWENFIRRGQARQTDTGATNHWYYVIRDLEKIKTISSVQNIERASRIETTQTGFVLHGSDYEIAFDRVIHNSTEAAPEDYTLTLVKRKLYPWDVKSRTSDDKG
ncbi:uncharacterized protein LOC129778288 [Toxorhynchites rutilus septentrionalis]|uniref:uncharacterized protein LOC129778288 n=1 Tax=Toxorhynchites rutilus septentrionalis TaxID=329112 RepID=UPI00247B16A9|nr:uncharacterized protein LOC129778288 [Toxorhynchites rutilus septentrionalis]